jgi:hypothetical protein
MLVLVFWAVMPCAFAGGYKYSAKMLVATTPYGITAQKNKSATFTDVKTLKLFFSLKSWGSGSYVLAN